MLCQRLESAVSGVAAVIGKWLVDGRNIVALEYRSLTKLIISLLTYRNNYVTLSEEAWTKLREGFAATKKLKYVKYNIFPQVKFCDSLFPAHLCRFGEPRRLENKAYCQDDLLQINSSVQSLE